MPSQPTRFTFIFVTILFLLGLVACVRPVPNQEVPPTATPAAAQPEQPAPPEGGEVIEQPVQPEQPEQPQQPDAGYPAEGSEGTPPEQPQEPTPPEGESPRPEGESGEGVVIEPEEGTTVDEVAQEGTGEAQVVPPPVQPEAGVGGSEPAVGQRPTEPLVHIVQPGENLYRIGLRYGYSWVVLQQYNGLYNPNVLTVGQEIRIPGTGGTGGGVPDPIPTDGTYIVQPGDTLFRIGQRFGVDWRLIAEANGIVNPNRIYPGQVLKIPTTAVPLPGTTGSNDAPAGIGGAGEINHVVQEGETLFAVALRYGVPWPYIAQSNNLEAPFALYAGQTLIITGGN